MSYRLFIFYMATTFAAGMIFGASKMYRHTTEKSVWGGLSRYLASRVREGWEWSVPRLHSVRESAERHTHSLLEWADPNPPQTLITLAIALSVVLESETALILGVAAGMMWIAERREWLDIGPLERERGNP